MGCGASTPKSYVNANFHTNVVVGPSVVVTKPSNETQVVPFCEDYIAYDSNTRGLLAGGNSFEQNTMLTSLTFAIEAHKAWYERLKALISQAREFFSQNSGSRNKNLTWVNEWSAMKLKLKDDHSCDFGIWLFGDAKESFPAWFAVVEQHTLFHKLVEHVMRMAEVDPEKAERAIRSGDLAQTSKKLLGTLEAIAKDIVTRKTNPATCSTISKASTMSSGSEQ